ncbi:DUF3618 domain-containing protein [uncultured Pseudokineococcus sp.]|uniref:DUF3618 domain-containing protein n=1 Tax=uncultured Pseudokineococcus sp. TaxID=1642928 RepID=UPI0026073732|nr:DUF3618 domain-containing protein [uncultured Pseudokineococcus sp.]
MSFPASPARDQRASQAPARRQPRTQPLPSDPAELEKVIRGQQNQLASDVDALVDLVSPKNVIARLKADLTKRGRDAVLTPDGQPRTERLAAGGAGVLGVLALAVLRAVRKRRRKHARREIEKAVTRGQKRGGRDATVRRRRDDDD